MVGKSVFLRPPTYEDASEGPWYSWFNDVEATRYSRHGTVENTRADQIKFYEDSLVDEGRRVFAVCDRNDGVMIGVTSVQAIDIKNRKAELAIMIGDPRFRPSMAGLEAWGLVTQYAFDNLPVEKLWAGSHEGLRSWVELLGVFGYTIEAELPYEIWDGDVPSSVLKYACYRSTYYELLSRHGELDIARWSRAYFSRNR